MLKMVDAASSTSIPVAHHVAQPRENPGYKFKNKASSTTFANNAITVKEGSNEGVSLTKAEYQQLIGLLNS